MSDMSSMNRESKKRQLRKQIVPPPAPPEEDSEAIVRQAHAKVRKKRLRIFFLAAVILAVLGLGLYQYFNYRQYTDYAVVWSKELKMGSFVGCEAFGSNVLRYSRDGASYINSSGDEVWVQSYEMTSPTVAVNGAYAAIADQRGNSIYIFNENGNTGVATTLLPIVKVTVSSGGIVAAILEDSAASYIYFFNRDGSALDVTIKALLDGEIGYPIDISLSPGGTQLMGAYARLTNSGISGRVAFHNFSQIGQSVNNRFVGGFDDIYEAALVARVHFLDETHSCAFADNSISFFSTRNQLSPELIKQVILEDEIRSVFYSEDYAGVIVNNSDGENPERLEVYSQTGELVFSVPFNYQYTHADIDGDKVILYNEDSCRIYTMSGRLKFSGTFDFSVAKIRSGRFPNTLIVTGPANMQEIRLQ